VHVYLIHGRLKRTGTKVIPLKTITGVTSSLYLSLSLMNLILDHSCLQIKAKDYQGVPLHLSKISPIPVKTNHWKKKWKNNLVKIMHNKLKYFCLNTFENIDQGS